MAAHQRSDASLRGYLNGILALASLCSEWIGRSDAGVYVYAADEFPQRFLKEQRIKTPLVLRESGETFRQTLVQWLGATDFRLCDRVVALFEYELGAAKRVLRAEDERTLLDALSASEGGFGAYFFTEDVFFVEFAEYTLAFVMGNNE